MAVVPTAMQSAARRLRASSVYLCAVVPLMRLKQRYVKKQEGHRRLLLAVQLVYVLLFTAWLVDSHTWPAPDVVAIFLLCFAIFAARGLSFMRDWTPFMVLLLGYVALPGIAPGLIARAHVQFPIDADRWLFGVLPTTWLQDHLWVEGQLHWYDYYASFMYLLHFIAPLVLAFIFWMWHKRLYWRFVRSYLLLMYAGFATYLIYPMAPRWWASDQHLIPYVHRVLSAVNWAGISDPVVFLSKYFQTDPVAAMPSMHAAFPMLVWLVVWRVWPRWGWAFVIYPIGMAFSVVYAGEHYLIDILAGWLYAAVAFAIIWGGYGLPWRRGRESAGERTVELPAEAA